MRDCACKYGICYGSVFVQDCVCGCVWLCEFVVVCVSVCVGMYCCVRE